MLTLNLAKDILSTYFVPLTCQYKLSAILHWQHEKYELKMTSEIKLHKNKHNQVHARITIPVMFCTDVKIEWRTQFVKTKSALTDQSCSLRYRCTLGC